MDEKETKTVEAFQEAVRKVMVKMMDNNDFRYQMAGSATYSSLLKAYAMSLGKELPEMASLMKVEKMWDLLHAKTEAGA